MRIISIFLLPTVVCLTCAFVPSDHRQVDFRKLALSAEGGAPQYDKRTAILRQAEVVGEGSVMLHIEKDDDGGLLDYQAGHVLALEIQNTANDLDEKTAKDAENNGGWMRGPYTVSRATESSINILIKVVGEKSKAFASAEPGTPVKFGGQFKVPIVEGISKNTKRFVLLSTGVGVGPCIGAIEKLVSDEQFSATVDLFASFRTEAEVVSRDHLNDLAAKHSEKFQWKPVITSDMGRLSSSEENIRMISKEGVCSVTETHYHLIGNGQMVNEWKAGLSKAGVSEEKITLEAYFNHKAESNEQAIEQIAYVVQAAAVSPVA